MFGGASESKLNEFNFRDCWDIYNWIHVFKCIKIMACKYWCIYIVHAVQKEDIQNI